MKKMLAVIVLALGLMLSVVGCGGCSSDLNENENGGQTQVETITTLEGTWKSEPNKRRAYNTIIIEGISIRIYYNRGEYSSNPADNNKDVLEWVGIYEPIEGPISEGTWVFEGDKITDHQGQTYICYPREFSYKDGKLSCKVDNPSIPNHPDTGEIRPSYFTRVSD